VTHDQTEAMTLGDRLAVMRSGVVQQAGSPHELYENPLNLFVAGFIGSSAMNFLGGTLEEGKLRTGLGDLPLSGQLLELGSSARGRQIIVGIRPEDFEDASLVPSETRHNGITFQSTIDVVESLGSEKYVYFTQDVGTVDAAELTELARDAGRADSGGTGETVVARFDPATRLTEGDHADIWVDTRRVHVFDPDTGQNLTLGGSSSPTTLTSPRSDDTPAQPEADAAGQDTGSAATPPVS